MPYVSIARGTRKQKHGFAENEVPKKIKIKKMTRPEWIRKKKLKKAQLRSRRTNR